MKHIMKVKLSLLDRKDAVFYDKIVEVCLGSAEGYEVIGSCTLYQDEDGRHFGDMTLDRAVDETMYFYYRCRVNDDAIFMFSGIDIMPNELVGKKTTRLGDMIIDR